MVRKRRSAVGLRGGSHEALVADPLGQIASGEKKPPASVFDLPLSSTASMLNDQARAPTPDLVRRLRTLNVARQSDAIHLRPCSDDVKPRDHCAGSFVHGCRSDSGLRSLLCSLRARARHVWLLRRPPLLPLRLAVAMRRPLDADSVAPEPIRTHPLSQPQTLPPPPALHPLNKTLCCRFTGVQTIHRPPVGATSDAPPTTCPAPPQPHDA